MTLTQSAHIRFTVHHHNCKMNTTANSSAPQLFFYNSNPDMKQQDTCIWYTSFIAYNKDESKRFWFAV